MNGRPGISSPAHCDQASRPRRGRRRQIEKALQTRGRPSAVASGILCIDDTLKDAVRLAFPKGAQLQDPIMVFNTRLDSNTVRATDFHEGITVDEAVLQVLFLEAVGLNT